MKRLAMFLALLFVWSAAVEAGTTDQERFVKALDRMMVGLGRGC